MAIPSEHMKERLSYVYVRAVAAIAGAALAIPEDYGDDGHIQEIQRLPNGKFRSTGFLFHCQIKSTTNISIYKDLIAYDMEAEAYNKLANWEGNAPCLLLLIRLPQDPSEWLCISEDQLLLRHCCYWYHITEPSTTNLSSQRIFVPRTQVFTPETVIGWLNKVRTGDYLNVYDASRHLP